MTPDNTRPGGSEEEQEALDTILNSEEDRPAVSESVFTERYLPVFAGVSEGSDKIDSWLDIAGNVYRSVDIMRDGEVVFTVPPLVRRIHPSTLRRRGGSMTDAMEMILKKTQQAPRAGQAYAAREVEERVQATTIEKDPIGVWNEIFVYYGYGPIVDEETVAESQEEEGEESSSGKDQEIFLNGDELL